MITHKFEINNRTFLAVGLPADADRFKIFNDEQPYLSYFIGTEVKREYLPSGQYKFIGLYPGMEESVAASIVDLLTPGHPIKLYRNYKYDVPQPVSFTCSSVLESFASKMQAERLYLVNPCGEKPKKNDFEIQPGAKIYDLTLYVNALHDWQEAESRTFPAFAIIEQIKK